MDKEAVCFHVAQDAFSAALSWVTRSIPKTPTQPILRGILIEADAEGLYLSGYDREVSTRVRILADVETEGKILLPGKLASDIINSLPNKPINLKYVDNKALVTCGSSRFELPTMTIEDYPVLPEIPAVTGSIDPQLFSESISQVAVAAGKDDTLPMLTGIKMEVTGTHIVLAATDRFRLAVRNVEWTPTEEDTSLEILIPAHTLADTARTIGHNSGEPVEIALGQGDEVARDGLLGIATEDRHTTTRLLDADFPKFHTLLPKENRSLATVEIEPLKNAIRRVALVSDSDAQIRLDFTPGQVRLTAGSSGVGTAEEIIECDFYGEPLEIAFNSKYLRDGLDAISTSRVVFGFVLPSKPAIFIPEPEQLPEPNDDGTYPTPDTNFIYLLMPVRLPS